MFEDRNINFTFNNNRMTEIKRENNSLLNRLTRIAVKPGEYAPVSSTWIIFDGL